MNKRLLSLLLTLVLLLCAASGLGEQTTSLTGAKIGALQKLAGDANTPWNEGARPTPDMNALQAWQWTDWFLSNQVRSLLGTIQDYDQLDLNNTLDPETEDVQWKLLEMENTLSRFEALLEEDRLAILNGISLYQSSEASAAERQNAVSRTLEAESEIKQIIRTICGNYESYLALVNECSNRLDNQNAESALNGRLEELTAEANAIENIENGANADFEISVISRHQFRIQVKDSNDQAISGAQVKVTNQLNTAKTKTLTTNSSGNAIFSVSDMGADEKDEMRLNLRITASGYRTREVKTLKLYGGDTIPFYMEKNDGKPYLIMGVFNGGDILSEKNTFYYSAKNDLAHAFSVKLSSSTDGTLSLCSLSDGSATETVIASKAFTASDSDKTEFVFEDTWLRKLLPGTKVRFKIVTKDNQEYLFDTQLDIQKAVVEEPFLSSSSTLFKFFGGDGGFGFDIPSEVPFIGGSRLAVSIPGNNPKLMILPSGRAMFAWGTDFTHEQLSWKSQDAQDQANATKEFEARSTADKLLAKAGAYRNVNTTTEPKMLGSFGASVSPFVSLQGAYYTSEHLLDMNGSVGATLAFKAGFTQTFTFGPVPFFAGVDFSMGASFGLDADVKVKMELVNGVLAATEDPTIKYIDGDKSGFSINIRLELGGTIGLGLQDVASVALRGYGYLNPVVDLAIGGVSANAKYGMGMGVTVRVLFLKWQHTLINKEEDLGQSNSAMTLSAPSDGDYQHFDSEGAHEPVLSAENSITSYNSGVEPTETKQVFSQIDSATGDFQYAVIGGDTYLFWIQPLTPSGTNKVGARVWWRNLNDTSKHGEVTWLSENSIPNVNDSENGSTINRKTYADYDFAVEVSRGLNNQTSSFCALTILSGMFSGTGSGTSPQAPDSSVLATVLMKQNANKELEIVFYQEHTREFRKDNYAVMPEVFLTATGDSKKSVYIVSTCSSSSDQRYIYGQIAYTQDPLSQTSLDGLAVLDQNAFKDGYSIARYHVGISDAAKTWPDEKINIYSLNRNDNTGLSELSHISYENRILLAQGNIVNFRVYSQLDTTATRDRLFYLERVGHEDGTYTNRLKWITVDPGNPTAFPPSKGYSVEINTDQFDIVKFGSGVYLYWTECSTPDPTKPTAQEKYMVRCLRYDPGTDTVCGPFNMVELTESPNTIKLQDSGTGFYSVDLQTSPGSYLRQSFSKFTYKLVSAAELTAATPTDKSVCAGDYAEIVFSVRNTGNVPLSGLNVKIKNGSKEIQTLHIDCANPANNSSAVNSANGVKVMNGAYTVSRISGMYDALNNESWEITRTNANGTTTVQSVQAAMLMPGDTHCYAAKLLVPTDWSGDMTLTAEIDSVEGDIAVNGAVENGVLMLKGVPQNGTNDSIMISRPGKDVQLLDTDVHDLSLSARIFKLNGEDYVRVSIKNLSGNTESSVTPILTSSYRGATLFTHQFIRSMGDDFGYSMDIPLRTLTKGRGLKELDLYVSANGNYEEFVNSDNHVRLLLDTQLCIIEHPVSIPVSAGQEAVFSVTAAGGGKPYRYQWQRMIGTDRWENIPGAKEDTYRIESVKDEQNGLTVRCVVTDQFGDSVTSDSATLTLLPQTGDSSQLTLWL
ncbi:MAG: carboxypeptidase-like regulatory domain-containing protein, partial [Candidatus Ventricola sp.]